MSEPKPLKIAIAIPMYNSVTSVFFKHFIPFMIESQKKYLLQYITVDSTVIDVARNGITDLFIKSDADYLLFLDTDMVFPANVVDILVGHRKDMVSALYFTRKNIAPMHRFYRNGEWVRPNALTQDEINKLLKVDAVGLGCVLIHRNVLVKVDAMNPEKPLFKTEFKNREVSVGEDVYFCDLVRKAGFEIYVDTGLLVGHYGGIIPEQVFKNYVY